MSYPHDFSGYPVGYSNGLFLLNIPLSAAGRILFVLIQKGFKKIKFAVMQTNER